MGRAFCDAHRDRYELVGLSRSARDATADRGPHRWRSADLFSQLQTERALAGCDVAVYLILADNFGRATAQGGVEKSIDLGGLIPETKRLSKHLASRREVEDALAAHGVPVTTLRAGLVVGAGGSSFEILRKFVERLPAMLCPPLDRDPT